jgi:hypothetical protein
MTQIVLGKPDCQKQQSPCVLQAYCTASKATQALTGDDTQELREGVRGGDGVNAMA